MKSRVPPCPCGRHLAYETCCGRWHAGAPAPDAESLMRSRYTAYVMKLEDYLMATWAIDQRPERLDLHTGPAPKWIGLEVKRHTPTGADSAIVEFVARYKIGGRACRIHEASRFVRTDDRWFYVDGDIIDSQPG